MIQSHGFLEPEDRNRLYSCTDFSGYSLPPSTEPTLLRHVYVHVCTQTHSPSHYSLSPYDVLEEVWHIACKTGSALNMEAQEEGLDLSLQ